MAARKYSLAAATGDWILYIDAGERLDAAGNGSFKTFACC
jgi:glycosyltransferase involved in cell wall biosynthesis